VLALVARGAVPSPAQLAGHALVVLAVVAFVAWTTPLRTREAVTVRA
jgi:hypothetical protein